MLRTNARHWCVRLACLGLLAAMGCGSRESVREKVLGERFREAASSFCDEAESLVKLIESDAKMAERHPQATKMDDHWLRALEPPKGLEDLSPRIEKARKAVLDESGALSDIQENHRDRPVEQKEARQKQLVRIPALRAELQDIRTKVSKK